MKKSLLFAAALISSIAASAQTIVWPCSVDRASKAANTSATVTGSETLKAADIVLGADMTIGQKDDANAIVAVKDADGANTNFPNDEVGMIAWRPTNGNVDGSEATADLAEGAGAYIDLTFEEEDIEKDLTGISSIEFCVTKVGTDAIRINCKLLGEGDGDINSGWLINETNAYSFNDDYAETDGSKGDPWDEDANGYNPSRNDGSKGAAAGGANANGISHVKLTLPAEVKALNPYKLTLRIVSIKCANNKDLGLSNVTINFGEDTGVKTVKAAAQNGAIYNVAGQEVSESYKGLVIKNGKKTIQ